jgi:hypothetical protein
MPVPLEFNVKANTSQYRAEMAQVKAIALGTTRSANSTGGHGGMGLSSGGGTSGMMRESLVIMREIGRGNWARVPGSVTLLIQYMGGLSKILKVTRSSLAAHADELEKEARAMANAAAKEAWRNGTSKACVAVAYAKQAAENAATLAIEKQALANAAVGESSAEAAVLEAAAAQAKVSASNLAIIAKHAEANAYAEGAEIEGAATTTALGPIGWLIAAVVALGVAVYFVVGHFKRLADQHRHMDEAMLGLDDQFERQTKRMDEAADAARKLAEEIANVHKHQKTLAEGSDEVVESLKRNAQAKANLAKEGKQIQLDEIDLAEKMHKISAQEATRRRSAVEIQAVKAEQDAKVKALTAEKTQRDAALKGARNADRMATMLFTARNKKSTASGPEGQKKITELADITRRESVLAKQADAIATMQREKSGPGFLNSAVRGAAGLMGNNYGDTKYMNAPVMVDGKEMPRAKLADVLASLAAEQAKKKAAQDGMTPAQIATAEAKAKMQSTAGSVQRLAVEASKAAQARADQRKNGAALVAAQTKHLKLQEAAALYEEGQRGVTQGFGLNSQQKVGAYAAMPPDFKRLVDAAVRTANNTDPHPEAFNPVGSEPARFGPGRRA